jgi:hypothetical protein
MAHVAAIGQYFRQLPADHFPNIVELAGLLTPPAAKSLLIHCLAFQPADAARNHE